MIVQCQLNVLYVSCVCKVCEMSQQCTFCMKYIQHLCKMLQNSTRSVKFHQKVWKCYCKVGNTYFQTEFSAPSICVMYLTCINVLKLACCILSYQSSTHRQTSKKNKSVCIHNQLSVSCLYCVEKVCESS